MDVSAVQQLVRLYRFRSECGIMTSGCDVRSHVCEHFCSRLLWPSSSKWPTTHSSKSIFDPFRVFYFFFLVFSPFVLFAAAVVAIFYWKNASDVRNKCGKWIKTSQNTIRKLHFETLNDYFFMYTYNWDFSFRFQMAVLCLAKLIFASWMPRTQFDPFSRSHSLFAVLMFKTLHSVPVFSFLLA